VKRETDAIARKFGPHMVTLDEHLPASIKKDKPVDEVDAWLGDRWKRLESEFNGPEIQQLLLCCAGESKPTQRSLALAAGNSERNFKRRIHRLRQPINAP
jgi:hypothetical protein